MNGKGRNCKKAILWRKEILLIGNHQCKKCDSRKNLVAHHIIEWNKSIELRFDVKNGEVLCRSCHMKHHTTILSKETKKKMSDSAKKINHSIDRNKKISNAKKGIKFTEEHKAKLSAAKKGKISWNKGITGKQSHMYGKSMNHAGKTWKIDPETKKRIWY